MVNASLAPIKRAGLFFGFMGVAVATLTFGAGLQVPGDQSSTSVAQAKVERHQPTDQQFASVDPGQKVVGATKRAIPSSQQAMLGGSRDSVTR
jgi:hypothetical protein